MILASDTMATTEINGNSVDPEEKPLFEVYTFNGKTLGQLKKDIPGYGRVYYKVKKVHELNEEKGELLCTCFAIRDKVWLPIQTALRLEQRNPLVSGPVAKFFEDQIEANLNVELVFSDDEENPSEEAEEPGSSLENDVNKVEIPSEITEQLEAIRKIPVSPQKELEEEVLALNQCSSTDNGHTDQLEVVEEDAPGFSGGRHANRAPIPAENSATAPEINASPSENHNLEEIVGSQSQESAENEVEFKFLESKQSPSDSVDRALGIAEKESEVNEKGDNNKEKTMETPSTSDSSSNSPSTSSKSDNEEDQKPDNVPCTSKSEEINETRMEIELKQGEEESFLKPNESPRRTRRGRTVSNASSRSSPEKKIGEQEVLEGKGVPEEMSEDVSSKLDENAEEASPQSSQNRRSTRRGRTASLASSKSDQEKTLEEQNEGSFAQMEVESQGSIANEIEGEDMEGHNNVEKSMLASENSSQKSDKSPTRRSTRSGRTASLTSSKSGQEKSLEEQKEGVDGQGEAQEQKEEEQIVENVLEDHTERIEEKIEDVSQSSQKLDENLRKRGGRRSRTSTSASSSPEKMLIDEQSVESEAQKSLEDKIDDIPKNSEEADQSSQQLNESLEKRGGRRGRTSIRGSSSPEKKIVGEKDVLEEKEVPEETTEDTSAKVDENAEESSPKSSQSRRSTRRGRTASNTSFRSSPEKKIVGEQEVLEGKEVPEETSEDVSDKVDENAEGASPQSNHSRRSTRRGRTASLASSKSDQDKSLEVQNQASLSQMEVESQGSIANEIEGEDVEGHNNVEKSTLATRNSNQKSDKSPTRRSTRRGRTASLASSKSGQEQSLEGQKESVEGQAEAQEQKEEKRIEERTLEDQTERIEENIEDASPSSQKLEENLRKRGGRRSRTSIRASSSPEKKPVDQQSLEDEAQKPSEDKIDDISKNIEEIDQSSQKLNVKPGRKRTSSIASAKSDQERTLEVQNEGSFTQMEVESQDSLAVESKGADLEGKRSIEKSKLASGNSSQKSDKSPTRRSTRSGRTASLASSKSGQEQSLEGQKESGDAQAEAEEQKEEKQIEENALEDHTEKIEDKIEDVSQSSQKLEENLRKRGGRRGRTLTNASSSPEKMLIDEQSLENEAQKSLEDKIDDIPKNSEEAEQSGRKLNVKPRRKRTASLASSKSSQQQVAESRDESEVSQEKIAREDVEIAENPEEMEDTGRDRVLRGRKRVDPKSGSRVKVAKPKKNQKEEESSQEQKDKEEEAVVGQVQDPESLDLDKSEEKNVEIAQEPSEPRKRGRPGRKKKIAHEPGYKSSPETKKKDDSKERLQIPSKSDATGTPEPSGSQNSNFMTPPTKRGPGRPRKTPIQADLHTPGSSAISENSKEKKVNNELENSLNESLQSEEDGGRRSGRLRSKPERLVISTKIATKSSPPLTTESPAPSRTPAPAETPAPETPTEAQPSPTWSTPSKGRGRPRKYLPGHEPYKIARPYIKKADRERMEKEKESRISRHSRRSKEEQEAIRKFNIRCAKGIFNMGEETEEDN